MKAQYLHPHFGPGSQPEVVCVCPGLIRIRPSSPLLVGEGGDHVSLSSCPKCLLHPGHGHHVLLGERPSWVSSSSTWGPGATASNRLRYSHTPLDPWASASKMGSVSTTGMLLPFTCLLPSALPGHRLGPQLGLKHGLAEDALPDRTIPAACFAYQDDPQGGGRFKALMFYTTC